jgi:hypothetical protein
MTGLSSLVSGRQVKEAHCQADRVKDKLSLQKTMGKGTLARVCDLSFFWVKKSTYSHDSYTNFFQIKLNLFCQDI